MNVILTLHDFAAISPLLILLGTSLLLLLFESFGEAGAKKKLFYLTLGGIVAAFLAVILSPSSENHLLSDWLKFDQLARFFTFLFLVIGFISVLLSFPFFQRFDVSQGEYYFLLLTSVLGLILIVSAADFLILFLGLETLSISLYLLCGYVKKWEFSKEASLKYFLMGALAAAFLLYGIALIYGAVGSTRFDALHAAYHSFETSSTKVLFLSGIALVTLGLAFKATVFPFHFWAPDVYDGAPNPVTAFMAVGTKVGAFGAFIRLFLDTLPQFDPLWNDLAAFLAYPTLIYANFVAIRQTQLRRFFAYSGISHAGFLLIPLAAGSPAAIPAMIYYLVVYAVATLGCFAVLAFLDHRSDGVTFHDLHGLFRRAPFLSAIFSLSLLTLAGIPPTAGFFAKFYIFKVGFQAGFYALVIVGLLTTILSAFYYLRIIAIMLSEAPIEKTVLPKAWPATLAGLMAFTAMVILSFFPSPLMELFAAL